MNLEGFTGMQMVEPEHDPKQDSSKPQAGSTGAAAGGPDLSGLLGALLGGASEAAPSGGQAPSSGGMDLGSLLGGLLGGETAPSGGQAPSGGIDLGSLLGGLLGGGAATGGPATSGLAGQPSLAQSVLQAAIPLVLGALMQGGKQRAAGIDLGATRATGIDLGATGVAAEDPQQAAYADLAGLLQKGQPIEAEFLKTTGLPQELTRRTGLDLPSAITAIQSILKALSSGGGAAGTKPKRKPKPKPSAAGSKPKSKPKPSASAKPKRKPAASAAKPKPSTGTTKPKPRRGSSKPRTGGSSSSRR